jgi:hypothetical protein
MDLIEIEQVSKQYLELFRRNFILLYELIKHDVMDIIYPKDQSAEPEQAEFENNMRIRG